MDERARRIVRMRNHVRGAIRTMNRIAASDLIACTTFIYYVYRLIIYHMFISDIRYWFSLRDHILRATTHG